MQNKQYESKDFFRFQQPFTFWIRIQLRMPSFMDKDLENKSSYKIYDDHFGTVSELFVDKEIIEFSGNSKTNYWLDLTMSGDGTYLNNFITRFDLEDKGGIKNYTIQLFDKNWGNIEQIITLALQSRYYKDGVYFQRNGGTINNKKGKKAINDFFFNGGNIEDIRIKMGYNNPVGPRNSSENPDLQVDPTMYQSWRKFDELRKEGMTITECPWIPGIITKVNRQIEEDGATYKIEVTSPFDVILSQIELTRQFAILRGSPFSLLNIINDVEKIYVQNTIELNGENNDSIRKKAINDFRRIFYNPEFAIASNPNEIDNGTPWDYNKEKKDSSKFFGAEKPRHKWITLEGESEAVSGNVDYQLLKQPPQTGSRPIRATLGSVLNEILREIPPKRYAVVMDTEGKPKGDSGTPIIEITDDLEKIISKEGEENLSNIFKNNNVPGYKDGESYIIDSNLSLLYRYSLKDHDEYGKMLLFYYGDRLNSDNKQEEIRYYKLRHPNEHAAIKFNIENDTSFNLLLCDYRVLGNTSSEVKEDPLRKAKELLLIEYDELEKLYNKVSSDVSVSGITKEKLEEKKIEIQDKLKITKQRIEETNKTLNLSINERTDPNTYSFGTSTINCKNGNVVEALANIVVNKIKLVLNGDLFYFFGDKIIPGNYIVKVDIYRPSVGYMLSATNSNIDGLLSGYYYIFNIKHSLGFSGFETTLELQRVPNMLVNKIIENN